MMPDLVNPKKTHEKNVIQGKNRVKGMRKTAIYFVLALALAAYVYFYEIKGGEERQKEKEISEKLFQVHKDSVQSIVIKSFLKTFRFEKTEDGWLIKEPVLTMADESPINTLLRSLTTTKKTRTIPVKPSELKDYGLTQRALTLIITTKSGERDSVRLGDKTSIGGNVYASRVDTMVYIIPQALKNNTGKSLFDWRDKKTIHFEKDKVRQLLLQSPEGRFNFVKEDNEWKLTEPIKTKAERSAVDGILNKLDFGRIKSVVSETADKVSKYGLNRPAYRIELFSGVEKAKSGVSFSLPKGNTVYGKDDVRPHIFTVDTLFLEPFKKDLFGFRDKKILDFERDRVTKLNLLYNDTLMTIEKDTSGTWRLSSGEKLKSWKINSLLSSLASLKAEKFVEENPPYLMPYGLVNPEGQIELFAEDDLMARLEIGKKKKDMIYARNPRRKQVVAIKKSKLKDIFPQKNEIVEEEKKNTKQEPEKS